MRAIPPSIPPSAFPSPTLVVSVALDSVPFTVGEGDGHVSVVAVLSGVADYPISATILTRPYSGPCKSQLSPSSYSLLL